MKAITRQILQRRKQRIESRLKPRNWEGQACPMYGASNLHYELSERSRGLDTGGIGAMHRLAKHVGLVEELDRRVEVLKAHLPYHESDHVLGIAYNVLCGGTCLEDIELRRTSEAYLDALGAQRIPDPTTAGDFCRRFAEAEIEAVQDAINETRLRVWRRQPKNFLAQATIDADGTMAATTGECKQGMDINYKGQWGYHPLVVSLAETQEPLYLANRPGNRPSSEGAAEYLDRAIALCRRAGFRRTTLRGDTDFTQTRHLDRWDGEKVRFLFGCDAHARLIEEAESLSKSAWRRLVRPERYRVRTSERRRPVNVKDAKVVERGFTNVRLIREDVAEFAYRPTRCKKTYRMIVVRKDLSIESGQRQLYEQYRYFFYITNDRRALAGKLVLEANGRCNQENLIAQLHSGVRATRMPVDNLLSNWAYMVMTSLAWTLKAWFALLLPDKGRWGERYRQQKAAVLKMEFRTFLNAFMRVPAQVIRQGRRIVFRLLAWNPWQDVFLRGFEQLHGRLRC